MKTEKKLMVIMICLIGMAAFSGCLNSSESKIQGGMLAGELPQFANANLLIRGSAGETAVNTDAAGRFSASLPAGRYQLLLQNSKGELIVIRRELLVENNLTLVVTDVDLIPIPRVTSVSVPMIYDNSAIIEWETDIESDGHVEYGTTEVYGMASYADTELKTRHRIQLYDLQPATTYHFRIAASRYSLESTTSLSRDFAFTTEP